MNAKQKKRIEDLIELALDDATGSEKERNAAAVKVCRLIRKYNLLWNPLDALEGSSSEGMRLANEALEIIADPKVARGAKNAKKLFEQILGRR